MTQPKISIVIATYNSARHIERAIKSILEQTYPDYEIIVVDGLSTDGTQELVKGFGNLVAKFSSEKDNGIYDAFNKGVAMASGEWVCFLGSDDVFHDAGVFTFMTDQFNKADETGCGYIYGQVLSVDVNGNAIELAGDSWEKSSKSFHKAMNINHCGAFTRAEVFKNHGHFNPEFKIAGDYDFLLRVFKQGVKPYFVEKAIVKMQTGGASTNIKMKKKLIKEVRRSLALNGYNPCNEKVLLWYLKIHAARLVYALAGERTLHALANFTMAITGNKKRWPV